MPHGTSSRRVGGVKLTRSKTTQNDCVDLGTSIVDARRLATDRVHWQRFCDSLVLAGVESCFISLVMHQIGFRIGQCCTMYL